MSSLFGLFQRRVVSAGTFELGARSVVNLRIMGQLRVGARSNSDPGLEHQACEVGASWALGVFCRP